MRKSGSKLKKIKHAYIAYRSGWRQVRDKSEIFGEKNADNNSVATSAARRRSEVPLLVSG
jgi:hypothetical protein